MKSNTTKAIVVILLLSAVLFARLYRGVHTHITEGGQLATTTSSIHSGDHQSIIDPATPLIYTKHARCRMACRHISEGDIKEVLREGYINEAKSKQEQGKCPTYAIEDNRNSDGVRLRIVFAKCETEVRVVTCIDRDDEFSCDCQ